MDGFKGLHKSDLIKRINGFFSGCVKLGAVVIPVRIFMVSYPNYICTTYFEITTALCGLNREYLCMNLFG